MRARFIRPVAHRYTAHLSWDDPEDHPGTCADGSRYHWGPDVVVTELPLAESAAKEKHWYPENPPREAFPAHCERCGAPAPADAHVGRARHTVFDTPSGRDEPGCIFEAPWLHDVCRWTNCDGRHLVAVLPNGSHWEITSRASNCTRPDDRTHRCWVVHEEAPGVFHVGKNGDTCAAGAGSIMMGDYHGFLHHGDFHLPHECTPRCHHG